LFAHANFDVKLGFLEKVVTTPQYHRVHHAVDMKLGHMNLAVVLPIWDILFGTYIDPRSVPAQFPVGLEKPAHPVKAFVGIGGG
jgi:sterol desaturase/sphingolipid hydroxylase (fatty acid hydroxylase superfamily)